jgi:type II secretory pathway component PulF
MYVSNGESSGQLAEGMDRVSKVLIDSAENNLKLISVIGFVVCLLFVAVLIGFTVITLYQRLYLDNLRELSL